MGILNYSTQVSAAKTVSEIQIFLAQKGATAIHVEYVDGGKPKALMFRLKVNEDFVTFKLPCNPEGVLKVFKKNGSRVPYGKQNMEQAEMTAWRIIKVWIESQLAIVEAGQAQIGEVFLPYAVTQSGATLYEAMSQNPSRLLAAAQPETSEQPETDAEYV